VGWGYRDQPSAVAIPSTWWLKFGCNLNTTIWNNSSMKRQGFFLFSLLQVLFLCLPFGVRGADPAAGQAKSQTCVACHGADGNSVVPNWPKLAGQHESYLVKELKEYREGEKGPRFEPTMFSMTMNLTDQDIADLAAFYASNKSTLGMASQAYVSEGEKMYRGGNLATGVTACTACHGPQGEGNEAARFPRLSGQHAQYIEDQLNAFRNGKRKNSPNGMMESIAHRMSDEEIKAVSSYIEGLR